MGKSSTKRTILSYAIGLILFAAACALQQTDDLVRNPHISRFMSLLAQSIFFAILTYWTVSVISRVSEKNIKAGLATSIILMTSVLLIRLIKYNVLFDATAERFAWYSYYIPQCLAPVVLFLVVLRMGRKTKKNLSALWNLLFVPAILLILFVFTNDFHEQVFSFAEGLENANRIYKWEWGYYVILGWIAGLYLAVGALLFIKCRVSSCRNKAWIPLVLFVGCLACCILRESFNPAFIKMPETAVFSVVIVCESVIRIGFIPSNTDYAKFFDVANISAVIADRDFNVEISSKNAPEITREQAIEAAQSGEIAISRDVMLKAKPIRGGEVFWTEDMSAINELNDNLAEINTALAEEIDLIAAENRIKEQRSKIEEQNSLYKEVFDIAQPYLEKISGSLARATTDEEVDKALRIAVVEGVFLKRRSNLILIKREKIPVSELVYALREAADALTLCDVSSSVFATVDGDYPLEQIELAFDCFVYCIERSFPGLSACLARLSENDGQLSCRFAIDGARNAISEDWRKEECDRLGATFKMEESDGTAFATLSFGKREAQR